MAKNTLFAITKEQSRFALSGAKLEADETETRLVATDGHRLSVSSIASVSAPFDVLIPDKTLKELARMANCTIDIRTGGSYVQFETGQRALTARKLDGTFPDYKVVLPKDADKIASFDIAPLHCAIKRAIPFTDPRNKSVVCSLSENALTLSVKDGDGGEWSEAFPCHYLDEQTTLGFNGQYLAEYLSNAGTGKGYLSFKDANSPVEFTIEGDKYNYRHILMPLRVEV